MVEKVLLITHSRSADPGEVGAALGRLGYEVERRCPRQGEPLPDAREAYAAALVLGGSQSANDPLPYLREEERWIEGALASGKPLLGICLGSQLIARVLGARVGPHPQGLREIGYFPIAPTSVGRGVFETELHVYHWHAEGFEMPRGAELLAEGSLFRNQAFRYGDRVYGIQFHPEVNRRIMTRWIESGAKDLGRPGAQSAEEQKAACSAHEARMHAWLERFLAHWLADGAAEG